MRWIGEGTRKSAGVILTSNPVLIAFMGVKRKRIKLKCWNDLRSSINLLLFGYFISEQVSGLNFIIQRVENLGWERKIHENCFVIHEHLEKVWKVFFMDNLAQKLKTLNLKRDWWVPFELSENTFLEGFGRKMLKKLLTPF